MHFGDHFGREKKGHHKVDCEGQVHEFRLHIKCFWSIHTDLKGIEITKINVFFYYNMMKAYS